MASRTTLIAVICVLALVAMGSLAAYQYERNRTPGVEISLDRNGLKIEER